MADKEHDEMIGKVLANQWEIIDVLGEGGVGNVYLAQHQRLGTYAAIKFLNSQLRNDPDTVERFKREVDILKRSAHPNIGVIHDCDLSGENPFIVMEFLEGPILKELLDEAPERRLHLQRIRRIFTQILAALGAVHDRGVIHRDLKPENVFILQLGGGRRNADVVKLIDFGIGKVRDGKTAAQANLTQVGFVMGTPFYMSPEQCRGKADVDGRTDLYAVGVMLYEAATGRLLFNKPTPAEIMVAHLNECPDAPAMINSELSPELEMVILRALAKTPEGRFQTAEEFSEALEAAIPEDPTFYRDRDSQRVTSVSGRAMATPPRISTPTPAEDDQPTAERAKPVDVSKTPTRLFSGKRPAAGIALARTVTPSGLKREMLKIKLAAMVRRSVRSGGAWMAAMAWKIARKADPWLSKPRPPHARYLHALQIFVVALGLSIFFIPIGDGDANASVDDGETADASAVADATGTETTPDVPRRDVVMIPVPVFVPTPPERDAGTDVPEDAGEAESESPEADAEEVEVAVETETVSPDYTERLAASLAEERRGDEWLLRGKLRRALETYQGSLDLLPAEADYDKVRLESKIRELERRLE